MFFFELQKCVCVCVCVYIYRRKYTYILKFRIVCSIHLFNLLITTVQSTIFKKLLPSNLNPLIWKGLRLHNVAWNILNLAFSVVFTPFLFFPLSCVKKKWKTIHEFLKLVILFQNLSLLLWANKIYSNISFATYYISDLYWIFGY